MDKFLNNGLSSERSNQLFKDRSNEIKKDRLQSFFSGQIKRHKENIEEIVFINKISKLDIEGSPLLKPTNLDFTLILI